MIRGIVQKGLLTATLVVASSTLAHATLIDFEGLTNGVQGVASLFYPEATFTSSTGNIYINGAGVSKDFCAYDVDGHCTGVLTVAFTNPVNNLSLDTAGDDGSGLLSSADVWVNGVFASTVGITYDGVFASYDHVDLTAFSNVTQLVLSSTDGAGVTWDNFSFDAAAPAVPEPSTWLLLGSGLLSLIRRRRRG